MNSFFKMKPLLVFLVLMLLSYGVRLQNPFLEDSRNVLLILLIGIIVWKKFSNKK